MFNVVLYQPEIPPNTGNVIRLCANTGAHLHLVEPLGFDLSEKQLRRAGLDYHDLARVTVHGDWQSVRLQLAQQRFFAVTTRGSVRHDQVPYQAGDVLLFGRETSGLPAEIHAEFLPQQKIRVPMQAANRSLNLSNTVAVVVYEAWRQLDFAENAF